MVLDASLLNTQHYKVRIKGKVEQSREGVAPSPTHCCSSYRKGSLRVTLDYGRQLYLLIYIYIYIYIYIIVLSCCQHAYPWPYFTISPYRSSLLAGLQGYISYLHRAAVCMFGLAVLLLLGHMWGPLLYITYELVPASPEISCMSSC